LLLEFILGDSMLQRVGDITLNSEYWDCECEDRYIQHDSVTQCPICKAEREDRPDSRQDEIESGKYFASLVVEPILVS